MKVILTLLVLALLAGCSNLKFLENRVAVTVSVLDPEGSCEVEFLSRWGFLSVGSQIAPQDAAVLCALVRQGAFTLKKN